MGDREEGAGEVVLEEALKEALGEFSKRVGKGLARFLDSLDQMRPADNALALRSGEGGGRGWLVLIIVTKAVAPK